jgi:hypothetical protein
MQLKPQDLNTFEAYKKAMKAAAGRLRRAWRRRTKLVGARETLPGTGTGIHARQRQPSGIPPHRLDSSVEDRNAFSAPGMTCFTFASACPEDGSHLSRRAYAVQAGLAARQAS